MTSLNENREETRSATKIVRHMIDGLSTKCVTASINFCSAVIVLRILLFLEIHIQFQKTGKIVYLSFDKFFVHV